MTRSLRLVARHIIKNRRTVVVGRRYVSLSQLLGDDDHCLKKSRPPTIKREFHGTTRQQAKRDWYDVLGVPRSATKQDIKKAYLKMAKKYHPDTSSEKDAVQKFQEASEAWEVLGDDDKRAAYDQYGHAAEEMGGSYERVDPFEAFRQAFGNGAFGGRGSVHDLDDILDDFFGQGRRRRRGPRRGPDVQLGFRLSFMEAAKGVQGKRVEWYEITRDGRQGEKQVTEMDVPPGVDSGMQIRLQGKGGRGDPGAPRGDLYLQIDVDPDDYFQRDGPDIHVSVDLDIVQAALGATVKVLTLDGLIDLTIPPGTQPDAKFRLKNKGLPFVNNRGPGGGSGLGAQYVHVNLRVPTNLTPYQRRLLEAFYNNDESDVPSDLRTDSAWKRLRRWFAGDDDNAKAQA